MIRIAPATLAVLAVFNVASSLASPVTVTWHSMQEGPSDAPVCNSSPVSRPHSPHSAPLHPRTDIIYSKRNEENRQKEKLIPVKLISRSVSAGLAKVLATEAERARPRARGARVQAATRRHAAVAARRAAAGHTAIHRSSENAEG